ncbi:MAG: arginine--tRNA ligase [Chitinophagaceae bacterium]|nr:MAG: arginine--tRNA ligase [Chitinophagaceae bacterium]
MGIVSELKEWIGRSLKNLYGQDFATGDLTVGNTKPEFEGDYTLVLFPFIKILKKSPELIGKELGEDLLASCPVVFSYNVIKGFLNITIADSYWLDLLEKNHQDSNFGKRSSGAGKVVVEYSSPNTNKPLHMGHLRNNFLGWSVAELLKATGHTVIKTAILNDRGIHICKSMNSWLKFAAGATPDTTGVKGDHFVGDYYVKAENTIKEQSAIILKSILDGDLSGIKEQADQAQVEKLLARFRESDAAGKKEEAAKIHDQLKEIARNNSEFMRETKQMLVDWEAGEPAVRALWEKMNSWVYEGFNETYKKIGSDFDQNYFESETYLLGKSFVEDGLKSGVFFRKEDGSCWIDLTADGLDEKIVLRKDGTSVYITQDLGLADKKYEQYGYDQSLYVIADEQNYHMKVLKLILQKLGKPYAEGIHHVSYGLVELPDGRMKTREGTVVDADDLIEELKSVARQKTEELGKVRDFNPGELNELLDTISIGALKFFLLRVDAKKKIIFNPEESIDFSGFTGPFIQWTHARIRSILRKASEEGYTASAAATSLLPTEKELIVLLEQFGIIIEQAVNDHNPSLIANYVYDVAKKYSSMNAELRVLTAESDEKKALRLKICLFAANVISSGMGLLGIRVPQRM